MSGEKRNVEWTTELGRPTFRIEVKCVCGQWVLCQHPLVNSCDGCGRDYNMSGQLLAPREQWGEETGETYSDIMRPMRDDEW